MGIVGGEKMKTCNDYREMLYLDVYGEGAQAFRPGFEEHLKICSMCRAERDELRHLIGTLRLRLPCPSLSTESAGELSRSVMKILREESISREGKWSRLRPFIPVLAAASLLIAALGWFEFGASEKALSPPRSVSKINSEEQLIFKDFDVINNMELLEDMETIRKVVKAVDSGDNNNLLIKRNIYVRMCV
jgi:hypothetical protein